MHIDTYQFGSITIDDRVFIQDVIIFPDRVQASWWRRKGHLLHIEDLEAVLADPPEVLIIGNGFAGAMQVPDDLIHELESRGIELHVANSRQAVALYNRLAPERERLVAALHLTC